MTPDRASPDLTTRLDEGPALHSHRLVDAGHVLDRVVDRVAAALDAPFPLLDPGALLA